MKFNADELTQYFSACAGQQESSIDEKLGTLYGLKYSGGGPLKPKHVWDERWVQTTPDGEHVRRKIHFSASPSVGFIVEKGVVTQVMDGALLSSLAAMAARAEMLDAGDFDGAEAL